MPGAFYDILVMRYISADHLLPLRQQYQWRD
jgi:hypothetical protein